MNAVAVSPSSGIPSTVVMIIIALLLVAFLVMCVIAGALIYCLYFRARAAGVAGNTIRRMDSPGLTPSFEKLPQGDREVEMKMMK